MNPANWESDLMRWRYWERKKPSLGDQLRHSMSAGTFALPSPMGVSAAGVGNLILSNISTADFLLFGLSLHFSDDIAGQNAFGNLGSGSQTPLPAPFISRADTETP